MAYMSGKKLTINDRTIQSERKRMAIDQMLQICSRVQSREQCLFSIAEMVSHNQFQVLEGTATLDS